MKAPDVVGAASRLLANVSGVALLVMTSWTIVDIVTRYALAKPLSGSIDLVESTLVLVVFLALPECFRRHEQITVDVLDHVVGERAVEFLRLIAAFATLMFLMLLGYTGIQPCLDAWQFGDRKPELPIPIFVLVGAIELGLAVSVAVLIGNFVLQLGRVFSRESV